MQVNSKAQAFNEYVKKAKLLKCPKCNMGYLRLRKVKCPFCGATPEEVQA